MDKSLWGLIGEHTSPLFRIMFVTNSENPARRIFDNNVSAFHIGNGYCLSVAHNLRSENPLLKSIPDTYFESEILEKLNPSQRDFFRNSYDHETGSAAWHLKSLPPPALQGVTEALRVCNFDTRWISLAEKKIASPFLIIQFRENAFFGNMEFTRQFDQAHHFPETILSRYTFMIPVQLEKAWYGNDIALYRMEAAFQPFAALIPFATLDTGLAENLDQEMICLQSSPAGFIGRMVNKATIEGYLDHYQTFSDRIGGNYILEGLRYLIRGYFRFGSSGAPYLLRPPGSETYHVNAIQSEASPVQLSINNNREGNFQYVNAIATPLQAIAGELNAITGLTAKAQTQHGSQV